MKLDDKQKDKLLQVQDEIKMLRKDMVEDLIIKLHRDLDKLPSEKAEMDFEKKKKLSDRYDLLRELLNRTGLSIGITELE